MGIPGHKSANQNTKQWQLLYFRVVKMRRVKGSAKTRITAALANERRLCNVVVDCVADSPVPGINRKLR